jgi:E3 ubiquitin-protein ligase TRIP12
VNINFKHSDKIPDAEPDPREKMLSEHPELLVGFGKNLFVVLVDMFTSTVNPSVRYKCLSAITKILYFETADMLKDLLEVRYRFLLI